MKLTSHWLGKNCKFAYDDVQPNENGDEKFQQRYVQWMSTDGNVFLPASKVVARLRPGFYAIGESMQVGTFFERIPLKTETLINFPETTSKEVVAEIETFWEKEGAFDDRGLAFKRGILLFGPPGSGKSSTIKLVLDDIVKRGGVAIQFDNPRMFSAGMSLLREIQEDTPVVAIMEDVDAILSNYSESSVINILDGLQGMRKVVFLATTNYPERLGSRITNRPSRFDKRFFIGMPNAESRELYIRAKIGNYDANIKKWVDDTEGLSIAHIKELITAVTILDNEYDDAIKTLRGMRQKLDSKAWDDVGQGEPQVLLMQASLPAGQKPLLASTKAFLAEGKKG